jgi:hypothetical protein
MQWPWRDSSFQNRSLESLRCKLADCEWSIIKPMVGLVAR